MYKDGNIGHVIDYKTGQYKPGTYGEQLELYALAAFMTYPTVTEVTAALWFLDTGDIVTAKFNYREVPELREKWDKATTQMLCDREFHPRPNDKCKWCSFSKAKGGPCEF
jgi:CRISPR/Cas system-associated exonuclease Cas4 (RecB family)